MKWKVKQLVVIGCLFLTMFLTTWAVAEDSQAKLTQVAGNHEKNVKRAPGNLEIATRIPEPTSMLAEIRAVMDSTRRAEQALIEEFGADLGPDLARRMGELKNSSRMRILHIQLKYAQEEGRTGLERRILTSIEDLQRPAVPGGPRPSGRISPPPVAQMAVKPTGGSPR